MAHIIIAGRPNSEDTAECIILSENLQAKFATVRFVKVLKHADEWDNYAEKLCNLYGFLKNTHPLIFYSNGSFIGTKEDFFKLVKSNFKIPLMNDDGKLILDYAVVKALTQEHIKITNEEYFTRIKGSKLRDKVDRKYEEISRMDFESHDILGRYNCLDSVYEQEFIGDLKVFYKYNNKFQPRDGEYQSHSDSLQTGTIEVEIPKTHVSSMSVNVDNSPIKNAGTNEEEIDKHDINEDLDMHEDEVVKEDENNDMTNEEKELENPDTTKKKLPKKAEIKFNYYKSFETPIYEVPSKDKFIIENDYGLNYKLIINPFLCYYGETLLFHDEITENKTSEHTIKICDYGRLPSLRKLNYDDNIIPLIKDHHGYSDFFKLSSLESNIYPSQIISDEDIQYMVKAVQEVKGIATLKILPYNYADFQHFGTSKIKILKLPLKDIKYEEIPLTKKIEQMVRFKKREKVKKVFEIQNEKEMNNSSHIRTTEKRIDVLIDNEEFMHFFDIKEHFQVETYQNLGIKHIVRSYSWQEFNTTNIIHDIRSFMKELNINQETGSGFILLLTKTYLFMAPLVNPFFHDKNSVPLFVDPMYFAGIYNLPVIEAEWPDTIKNEYVQFKFEDILKISTNPSTINK